MNRFKFLFIFVFILNTLLISEVKAYEFPDVDSACVISASDSRLGSVDIYVPCDRASDLAVQGNQLVNVTSSSFYGYANVRGEDISISFQPFQYGRYRLDGYNYDYLDFSSFDVNFSTYGQYRNVDSDTLQIVSIFVLGVLLWLIYTKR